MDDTQRIVKCGALSLHSAGGFFKKRWHSKYLVLYDGSKSGIKRLELFDSEIKFKKQNPAKIIPLVDCVRVVTCQRQKSTYTFEVRTNDQFYLLAAHTFQDMNDWVNCLRLVAFGQNSSQSSSHSQNQNQNQNQIQQQVIQQPTAASQAAALLASNNIKRAQLTTTNNTNKSGQQQIGLTNNPERSVDVLLEKRTLTATNNGPNHQQAIKSLKLPATSNRSEYVVDQPANKSLVVGGQPQAMTASQAAAAAASALAKTRQRQPSLLGSCKPQPPNDSPFINQQQTTANSQMMNTNSVSAVLSAIGQIDTLTPTVRGQLISASSANLMQLKEQSSQQQPVGRLQTTNKLITPVIQATLDEEEENMLYCSIEDNPSEHNYRVKVIETELSLRCQLKCYQLTAPTTISQQYEQLGQFSAKSGAYIGISNNSEQERLLAQPVTFYQLIIGPQELTLLNDYAAAAAAAANLKQQSILQQQQGLWSWPYQCIRRYGFDKDNCFMFEAGRKCTSGPGQFIVQTPKAYQIYQDVVKFVNELRSLNNTTTSQPSMVVEATTEPTKSITQPNTACPNLREEQRQKSGQSIVTQIPVTWTPNNTTNMGIDITVSETRQQFFDTLRQLDSSSSSSLVSSSPSLTNHVQQQTSSKNILDKKINPTIGTIEPTVKTNNLVNNLSSNTSQETSENRKDIQVLSTHLNSSSSISNSIQSNTSFNSNAISASSVPSANHNSRCRGDKQNIDNSSNNSLLTTNQKCDNSPSSDTPEETDESGYEQGDDSVEDNFSATSCLAKLTSSATRKRQANDSMSSSSSTASSSGGSPGHSVSRRSTSNGIGIGGANFNTQGPSKRPLLNTSSVASTVGVTHPSTTNNTANKGNKMSLSSQLNKSPVSKIIGLHNIIGDDPNEDFEANLIRDVYSEITKLHAKFAVTSGSTEDLMSSNSSNAGSSDNCSANSNEQDCESSSSAMAEPMYSNLRPPSTNSLMQERQRPQARGQAREARDFELEDEENVHPKISSSNNKCNQPTPQQSSQGYHIDHERSPLRNSYPFDYLSSQPPPPPPPPSQAIRGPLYTTMLNPIPEISEAPTSKQSYNNNAGGGRIRRIGPSTNHYVINDVQYAKISRNI